MGNAHCSMSSLLCRSITELHLSISFVRDFFLQQKAACPKCIMENVLTHHQRIICQHTRDENTPRDIYFLISFLISFNVDLNTLHRTAAKIRVCVCVHLHSVAMHSESLYAELTGNIAKTCRYTANNAKSRLKIHPPTHPSPLRMTAAWHFALKCKASHSFVSVWKGISTETNDSSHQVKGFGFFFLLNLHGASCCRFNPLIAVWAQINDTSEAPPDATEVQ